MKAIIGTGLAFAGSVATSAFAADGGELRRNGKLEIALAFDASGHRTDARTGADSRLTFSRGLTYVAVLRGFESATPEVRGPFSREHPPGSGVSDAKRFLNLIPLEERGRNGRSCGKGATTFQDVVEGMEYAGTLVPFRREHRGGGAFPSADRSVPERDLCLTAVSIDYVRKVFHIRIDGSDSSVKVRAFLDGKPSGRPFNLPLQGYDHDGAVKAKLTFFDVPLPADAAGGGTSIEGRRVIERFNTVLESGRSTFPLRATVEWRLSLD